MKSSTRCRVLTMIMQIHLAPNPRCTLYICIAKPMADKVRLRSYWVSVIRNHGFRCLLLIFWLLTSWLVFQRVGQTFETMSSKKDQEEQFKGSSSKPSKLLFGEACQSTYSFQGLTDIWRRFTAQIWTVKKSVNQWWNVCFPKKNNRNKRTAFQLK